MKKRGLGRKSLNVSLNGTPRVSGVFRASRGGEWVGEEAGFSKVCHWQPDLSFSQTLQHGLTLEPASQLDL